MANSTTDRDAEHCAQGTARPERRNVAAQIGGESPTEEKAFADIKAVCVMDAGNNGVIILADKMLPPREHGILIPARRHT